MWRRAFIRLNNWLTRRRGVRVPAGSILLLLPHCLQFSQCAHNITFDLDQCKRCGQCNIAELLTLRDRYGIPCKLASGGREAVARVKDPDIRAVVAVACEKELVDGIRACFPKPILAVTNVRPNGPCKDTRVDVERVVGALRELIA
jgi:hypothetical protein